MSREIQKSLNNARRNSSIFTSPSPVTGTLSTPLRRHSQTHSLVVQRLKTIRIRSLSNLRTKGRTALSLNPISATPSPLKRKLLETELDSAVFCSTPTQLQLALPIPPSINHQYATVNGRRVLSSKGRGYKTLVSGHIFTALLKSSHKKALLQNLRTHSLSLSIRFFFTSALRRDLDGGLKIAQDAISNALEINDNRILEIHLYKAIDSGNPRMEFTLSTISPLPSRLHTKGKKKRRFHRKITL